MALQIPVTGSFIAVDTSSTSKTVQLPLAGERQGRVITIKDRTGQANQNPIIIQTTGQDTFQDSSTSYKISNSFDSLTFIARSGKWLLYSGAVGFPSTIQGLGTLGFISSGTANIISTAQLTSSIQGLGTVGYLSSGILNIISTPQLTSSLIGLGSIGYLSSGNSNIISTPQLTSSLVGLASMGYISSAQLTSTAQGLTTYINSFIDPIELASSITGLGTLQFVSSIGLLSTSQGLANYITSFIDPLELASTVTGLGTAQYVSTTVNATNLIFTSSLVGLGSMGYLSSGTINVISTPQLFSSLIGLGTLGYLSSSALSSFSTSLANPLGNFNVMSTGRTTASTITLFDTLNSNAATDIYVRSTLLYFGGNVIGGTKVAQPQFFTF